MTAELSGNRVIIRDDNGKVIEGLSGEQAVKLGHDLIHAGEKALEQSGRIHED